MAGVIGDHLLQRPSGGFVGVDIFFVISGVLITGLLIREVERNGKIEILDFYRRRIKRTVPLAAIVIIATVLAGGLIFPAYRAAQLQSSAAAAATFSINWQLIAQGADYLHATDLPSPLQHFWSLAVEEQFYLVWPALLLVVGLAARKLSGSPNTRLPIGAAAGALTLTSAAWCAWQTSSTPTAAYFSSTSRGWELGVGAVLAAASPMLRRVPGAVAPALGWTGLLVLLVSFVVITPNSPFPAPWAILPVVATAAIIVASESGQDTQFYPLTNRASQHLGDLSYSLYLWHFPIVIFAAAFLAPSKGSHGTEVALMLGLSVLSFHLVERPLRQHSWRGVIQSLRQARLRLPIMPAWSVRRGLLLAATGVVAICAVLLPHFVNVTQAQAVPLEGLYSASVGPSTPAGAEQSVSAAASETRWPSSVTEQIRGQAQLFPAAWVDDGCLRPQASKEAITSMAKRCTYGDRGATRLAVIFGDSIAISYFPALQRALPASSWRIEILTSEQCPAFAMTIGRDDGSAYPECNAYRSSALDLIRSQHPDLVLTASSYSALWRWKGDAGATDADSAWRDGARSTIASLLRAAKQVLVLDAPQMSPPLRDCLTPVSTPSICAGAVDGSYVQAAKAEREAFSSVDGASRLLYPSTLSWYCTDAGVCPAFVNGEPTLSDGMHPSTADAPRIGTLISRVLANEPTTARSP